MPEKLRFGGYSTAVVSVKALGDDVKMRHSATSKHFGICCQVSCLLVRRAIWEKIPANVVM